MRSVMCMADVYRFYRKTEDAPKSSNEKKEHVNEDSQSIELLCASAHLIEAVESLSK
jgi:hypothetical protein